MKRPKITRRPNVMPAKQSALLTNQELVKHRLETKTQKMIRRVFIKDLCDFCLEKRYIRRWQFMLRKRKGWKFLCSKCADKGVAEYGKGILPCYISHHQWHK